MYKTTFPDPQKLLRKAQNGNVPKPASASAGSTADGTLDLHLSKHEQWVNTRQIALQKRKLRRAKKLVVNHKDIVIDTGVSPVKYTHNFTALESANMQIVNASGEIIEKNALVVFDTPVKTTHSMLNKTGYVTVGDTKKQLLHGIVQFASGNVMPYVFKLKTPLAIK